jgi:hypothetical protein
MGLDMVEVYYTFDTLNIMQFIFLEKLTLFCIKNLGQKAMSHI